MLRDLLQSPLRNLLLLPLLAFGVLATNRVAVAEESFLLGSNFSVTFRDNADQKSMTLDFCRQLEKMIQKMLTLAPSDKTRSFRIVFDGAIAEGAYFWKVDEYNGKELQIFVNDNQGAFRNSRPLCAVAVGCRVQSVLGIAAEEHLSDFPLWVSDAILLQMERNEQREGPVRLTFHPLLQSLILAELPVGITFAALQAPPEDRGKNSVWNALYRERALLLLEMLHTRANGSSQAVADLIVYMASGKVNAEEAFYLALEPPLLRSARRISGHELDQESEDVKTRTEQALEECAESALFNSYTPLPAQEVRKRFDAIKLFSYVTQTQEGETQKSISQTAALDELPFLIEKVDSCATVPGDTIRRIIKLSRASHSDLQRPLTVLTQVLAQTGRESKRKNAERIRTAVENIDRGIARQIAMESYLEEFENSLTPPLSRYQMHFETLQNATPELPGVMQQFFDQTEHSFYGGK